MFDDMNNQVESKINQTEDIYHENTRVQLHNFECYGSFYPWLETYSIIRNKKYAPE